MNELTIHSLFSEAAYEFPESAQRWMPKWLTQHKGFEQVEGNRIFKIFSKFGLSDFRETFEDPSSVEEFKDFVISGLSDVIRQITSKPDSPEVNRLEQVAYKLLRETMGPGPWVTDKHRITTQIASEDKTFRLDAGMSVIKAYNTVKVYAGAQGINMPDLESSKEFKAYSKRGQFSVVFSTDPTDIAAMSSRSNWGTCQTIHVEQGLGGCIVGSTLSKFVGIVYITTGNQYMAEPVHKNPNDLSSWKKQPRGEKMEARCLIRFAIDTRTKKPVLILDQMYPVYIPKFAQAIHAAIQKRAKIPVHDISNSEAIGVQPDNFARFRTPDEKTPGLKAHERTYRDTPAAFTDKSNEVKDNVYFTKQYIHDLYMWLEIKIADFIADAKHVDRDKISSSSRELAKSVFMGLLKEPRLAIAGHYSSGGKPLQAKKIKDIFLQELVKPINRVKIKKYVNTFADLRQKYYGDLYEGDEFRKHLTDYIYYQLVNIPEEYVI